jgi:hypothetical protein
MNNELVLKIKITSFGVIGYGNVYACEVLEVSQGTFEETQISLTTVTKDHGIDNFIPLLPVVVNIAFTKGKENEPYGNMPIDGFVDLQKTSWLVKEVTLVE